MDQEESVGSGEIAELPAGWTSGKLGDLIYMAGRIGWRGLKASEYTKEGPLFLSVFNLNKGDRVDFGEVHHISWERYDESPEIMLRENDILLAKDGAGIGKIGIVKHLPAPATVNSSLLVIRASQAFVPEFLFYFLKGPRMQEIVKSRIAGSATPHLFQRDIRQFTLLIPPLDEQRHIVAKLEELLPRLEAGVASLKRVQAALKRYRAAVLKAACEGRLVPQDPNDEPAEKLLERILAERRAKWEADMRAKGKDPKKAKYVEPARPETEGLPELPEGWCWATWDQLSPRVTVGFVGPMKHEYVDSGVPFLRSQNVRENRYKPEGLCYISERFHREIDKSTLHPGDLVVVRSGSVGVTCVIPDTLPEANCADLVVIQKPPEFEPLYGSYYMNSLAKRHVTAGKVGIALTHFNTKAVAALPVAVPPLAEQRRIVTEVEGLLSVTQESEHSIDASLARASRLRQAFLRRAFEGKLVAQNPSDEPASAILERIRHGRESAAMYNGEGKGRRGRQQRLPL